MPSARPMRIGWRIICTAMQSADNPALRQSAQRRERKLRDLEMQRLDLPKIARLLQCVDRGLRHRRVNIKQRDRLAARIAAPQGKVGDVYVMRAHSRT